MRITRTNLSTYWELFWNLKGGKYKITAVFVSWKNIWEAAKSPSALHLISQLSRRNNGGIRVISFVTFICYYLLEQWYLHHKVFSMAICSIEFKCTVNTYSMFNMDAKFICIWLNWICTLGTVISCDGKDINKPVAWHISAYGGLIFHPTTLQHPVVNRTTPKPMQQSFLTI